MLIKEIEINSFEDVVPHLEYPCFITMTFNYLPDKYRPEPDRLNKRTFKQWEGSWLFESLHYLERDNPYSVQSYCNNQSLTNKKIQINIPDKNEYIEIVKKRKGNWHNHLATDEEIGSYFEKIKKMKTKQQLIEEFLSQPIKVGDLIFVKGLGSQNKEIWGATTVLFIEGTTLYYDPYRNKKSVKDNCEKIDSSEVRRSISHIGPDPFKEELRLQIRSIDIESIVFQMGYDILSEKSENDLFIKRKGVKKRFKDWEDKSVPEVNFNPFIINEFNKKERFQRPLVWNLQDKQNLIDSIYNNIDLGKIVVRLRSYDWVTNECKKECGEPAFKDLVDGKQRITTILEFLNNEFTDSYGNYFNDLSGTGQQKILQYRNITYGELDNKATDKDVLNIFLSINFAGVSMSKEHIDYVKSIKL